MTKHFRLFNIFKPRASVTLWGDLSNFGGWGGSPVPVEISPTAAMACGAVYSCVRVLADGIAALPCVLMRRDGEMCRPDVGNTLYNVLNLEPLPAISSFTFWRWNITSLLLRGFFLSIIIRGGNGKILRLVPIHPSRVNQIELSADGTLLFSIVQRDGGVKVYPQSTVFYVPYALGRDLNYPEGPLHHAGTPIHLANAAEEYMYHHVKNDGKPNGYWKKDGTIKDETAFQRLKKQLNEATSNANTGKTPLVEEGIEFKPVALSAVDMQMIDQRRYTVEDICGRFGVPPHKIGDTAQAKGWSTLEQQQTEFVAESLGPIAIRIEKEIDRQLVPFQSWGTCFAKFKFNALLRGDTNARGNFYQKMWQLGVMSANDIRDLEDMNPVDGGDVYYRPLNFTDSNKQLPENNEDNNA